MAIAHQDKTIAEQAKRLSRELHVLYDAAKAYLARLERSDMTERDAIRLSNLIEFAVNVGHASDILERRIVQAAGRDDDVHSELDRDALLRLHARVSGDLKLALSTMMSEDQRSAHELVEAKRAVNEAERAAARDHLSRLGGGDSAALESSSPFLAMLRDLKLVNSHLASIGYAVLNPDENSSGVPVVEE